MGVFTLSNATFILGILGVIFTVYIRLTKPQEVLDKQQALIQTEVESKANILAQQLQWEKEANERRFKELAEGFSASRALAENHIHSIDVKVDNLRDMMGTVNVSIAKLSTIIDERMPKKIL